MTIRLTYSCSSRPLIGTIRVPLINLIFLKNPHHQPGNAGERSNFHSRPWLGPGCSAIRRPALALALTLALALIFA